MPRTRSGKSSFFEAERLRHDRVRRTYNARSSAPVLVVDVFPWTGAETFPVSMNKGAKTKVKKNLEVKTHARVSSEIDETRSKKKDGRLWIIVHVERSISHALVPEGLTVVELLRCLHEALKNEFFDIRQYKTLYRARKHVVGTHHALLSPKARLCSSEKKNNRMVVRMGTMYGVFNNM